jgi:transmembrane sensor
VSLEEWLAIGIPDDIADRAMAWIAKLDSESCSQQDHIAFQSWLAEDPIHQWAFEELSEFWARMNFADLDIISVPSEDQPDRARTEHSTYNLLAKIALVFIIIGMVAGI